MQPSRLRVVIVGGGITGLAAAHRLAEIDRERGFGVDVTLVESSHRLGGVIDTECAEGFVLEHGPDSILTEKPWAKQLAERIGLGARMIPTEDRHRGTYVVRGGRLVPLPEGFLMMAPTQIGAFLRSSVFSWTGKARIALELLIPRGHGGDESLASFVRRRFGREALDRAVQPLIGGIYSADPEKLSLAATMPRFLEMERTQRSVIKAMWQTQRRAPRESSGARWSLFFNFDRGSQVLVDELVRRIPETRVHLHEQVTALERTGSTWRVIMGGTSLTADAVIVAAPAHGAATILRPVDADLARDLAAIDWSSAAVVLLAYRSADVPRAIDGFGFVVPAVERRRIIAGSYSSRKYTGRAPDGFTLLRAFVGGFAQGAALAQNDEAIVADVRAEFADLLSIRAEPVLTRVRRWERSMPQYELGHLERVARIETRVGTIPGLALAGNSYRGVGIPDCVRDGEAAAERIAALQGPASSARSACTSAGPST